MGQDPNQQYPNQYGQPGSTPPQGGYPPQSGGYPPANPNYPPSGGYPPQQPTGYPPSGGYPPQQPGGYPPSGPGYQYQQPGAGTQYNVGYNNNGPSSSNMDPNVAAGLSYVLGWVTGLIFFLIEKQNRFVRFNAMQSIVLSGAAMIVSIVLTVASTILTVAVPLFGCLFGLVQAVVGIGFLVFWIICMVNSFQGKFYKIPVLGDYAERWAGPGGTPPSYS